MVKRKFPFAAKTNGAAFKKRRIVKAPRAGFQRTSGFYGRFTGANAELKFHDLDIDDAVVAQNGTIAEDSCNGIAQGVTESQRIGRKCVIKNIGWRYTLLRQLESAAVGLAPEAVRVILYLDKQANGATATVTGILESDDYQSFNNLANTSRFKILMDRTHTLQVGTSAGDGTTNDTNGWQLDASFFKKCNIPIEFDSTTGAITEVRSNNIGVLLLGKTGASGVFNSKMRLRFSDSG